MAHFDQSIAGSEPGKLREYGTLLAFIAFLSILLGLVAQVNKASSRDFICYWTAGQLFSRADNPYQADTVFQIEKSQGYSNPSPEILRNPPTALLFLLPLGLLNARAANILWLFIIVSAIVLSLHGIRGLYGDRQSRIHLFGYAFAPTLICIGAGQIVALDLAALVLFLVLYRTRPFLAGCALSACAIKPHVLVPFLIALALWIIVEKRARIALGMVTGLAILSAAPLLIRPSIWSDYIAMMRSAHLDEEFYPTASTLLRLAIHPAWAWLQIVPVVIAAVWAAGYYLQNRSQWKWTGYQSYLLLVLSVFVAPRAWVTDEIVLLPALLFLCYERSSITALISLAFCSLVAIVEMFAGVQITSPYYLWTTTAWLACFIGSIPALNSCSTVEDRPSMEIPIRL